MSTLKITIVIIGASVAGINVLSNLLEKISDNSSVIKYDIVVVEPKSAFESIPTSWSLLHSDNFSNLTSSTGAIGSNDLLNPQSIPIPPIYLAQIQSIHQNFNQHFVPYNKSSFFYAPNVHIIHGFVGKTHSTHCTITIPEHLQNLLPPSLSSPPDPDTHIQTNDILTNRRLMDTPSGRTLQFDLNFHVLFDCSGANSTNPTKTSEILPHLSLFKSSLEYYPTYLDLIKGLIELFFHFKLTTLSQFDEIHHQSLQTLCYLPLDIIKLLIIHYFPHLNDELFTIHETAMKDDPDLMPNASFHTYRTLALLCYTLHITPSCLVDYLAYEDDSPDYSPQTAQKKKRSNSRHKGPNLSRSQLQSSHLPTQTQGSPSTDLDGTDSATPSISFSADPRRGGGGSGLALENPQSHIIFDEPLSTPYEDSASTSRGYSLSSSRISGTMGSHFGQQTPTHPNIELNFPNSGRFDRNLADAQSQLYQVIVPTPLSDAVVKSLFQINKEGKLLQLPHDSILYRFIEFAAVRSTLLFLPPLSLNSAPFNDKFKLSSPLVSNTEYFATLPLPPIYKLNFVGGGITSVELLGIYLDVYQNRFNIHKKQEKEKKKFKTSDSPFHLSTDIQFPPLESLLKPHVNLFCAFTLTPTLTSSIQTKIFKHITTEFAQIASTVEVHENTMWGVATGLNKHQKDLSTLEHRYTHQLSEIGLNVPLPRSSFDSPAQPSFSTTLKDNKQWGLLNIFATGLQRNEVTQTYRSTKHLFSNESFEKLKAFISSTNNPEEAARSNNPRRPPSGHVLRPGNNNNNNNNNNINLDDDDYGATRDSGRISAHGTHASLKEISSFQSQSAQSSSSSHQRFKQDDQGLSRSIMNLTEAHTKGRLYLKKLPGLIFIVGDAATNHNIAYTATQCLKNAPIATENAVKYCKTILEPLISALISLHQNKIAKGQPPTKDATTPAVITNEDLASCIKKMKEVHTGSQDYTIQLSQSKILSTALFGSGSRESLREKLISSARGNKK